MGRGIKKFGVRVGKFIGKAVLNEAGITTGRNFKLTEEVKEDLAEVIASGVYAALVEFEKDTEAAILERPA